MIIPKILVAFFVVVLVLFIGDQGGQHYQSAGNDSLQLFQSL